MRSSSRSIVLLVVLAAWPAACAAPIQRPTVVTPPAPAGLAQMKPAPRHAAAARPAIGVAFGGGSARGIAHVGVIRWFEEHRIPIDVAAGTSMGGLIGGSFASGMDADELEAMLAAINWDEMFGSSTAARTTRARIPRAWSSG
jgi:NTE family protein